MSSSAKFGVADVGDNRKGHLYNEAADRFDITALTENISSAPYVFENPVGSTGKSFYHGKFWDNSSLDLGQFLWEAWICYLGTDGGSGHYWVSDGYGGAHAILCGPVNGNVWNGSGTVDFNASYAVQSGEWLHSMVYWNGSNIYIFVNGIICGITAFTGPRRCNAGFGELYIGGSDHSNFHGRISQVRAWESANSATAVNIPYSSPHELPFTPQRGLSPYRIQRFGNLVDEYASQFCVDYAVPGQSVIDQSPGFNGRLHHGIMLGDLLSETRPGGLWVQDPTCPQRLDSNVLPVRTNPVAPSTPPGAKIFDSFSRAQSLRAFTTTTTLGSTESGSLGSKAWVHRTSSSFGIFDGKAVLQGPGYDYAYVLNDSADMDVRIDRTSVEGLHNTGLVVRWVSASEFILVRTSGTMGAANIHVEQAINEAGNGSGIGLYSAPASWTTLRLVASGTTISTYCDGTLLGTATGITWGQTGLGAGIYSHWPPTTARRWDNFTVF